ncbi:MAG TPA: hypothetical protein VHF87_01040 [Methylomirabilota bacterium]|jgi:hypothetical protein|nr:hypothetical protein [Methylomirabilota bacterium]
MGVPFWARVLARWTRLTNVATRAHDIPRDEILLGFLPAQHRADYTELTYGGSRTYLPGERSSKGGSRAGNTRCSLTPPSREGGSDFRPPFDVVYIGWGGFTHLIERQEQLRLLRSLRRLAPGAPRSLVLLDPAAGDA